MNSDTTPVSTWRKHLTTREAWLTSACGPAIPTATKTVMAQADGEIKKWQNAGHAIAFETGSSHSWHQGISPKRLPLLASAYAANPNEDYALLAKAIYQRVMTAEPWHEGWLPPGKLQPLIIAHRLGNTENAGWFGALPAFLTSAHFDDAFVGDLIQSATAQLNYLKAHMHPGRNIRLTQADALMTQGLRLSLLPDATQWLCQGVHILNDGFNRLIAPDGASREATAWYHTIMLHMAMRLWRLKQADANLGLTITASKVAPMFDYTLASIEPDGRSTRIGDTVGKITPDTTLASFIALREKSLRELNSETALPSSAQFFNHVNQAMIRSDWSDTSDYLTFDATTRYGHHWHPGRNSLQLCLAGTRVLADPGRMSYDNTPHRQYALSTRGHSTLNLNCLQQTDTPATLRHAQTNLAQFLDGSYAAGYWPIQNSHHHQGVFARHQRSVLWIQNRFVLVIDHLSHTQGEDDKPAVEVLWHYAPGKVSLNAAGRCASSEHEHQQKHHRVQMNLHALLCPDEAAMTLHEGELEPQVLGWAANDVTDVPEPSPSVMLRIPRQDLWRLDLATLLVLGVNGSAPANIKQFHAHDASEKPYAHLQVTWDDGSTDGFWWTRDLLAALDEVHTDDVDEVGVHKFSPFITDASLLHVHTNAQGQPKHLTMIDGTFARATNSSWASPVSVEPCMASCDL